MEQLIEDILLDKYCIVFKTRNFYPIDMDTAHFQLLVQSHWDVWEHM